MAEQTALFEMSDPGSGAIFDPDRKYRYRLWRRWGEGPPAVWIMLNPSTADEDAPDPTLGRCVDFTKRWGHCALEIVNLYAYQAAKPSALLAVPDPVGPDNLRHIEYVIPTAALVMVGWGGNAKPAAIETVVDVLKRHRVRPHCLATNDNGQPTHPLYLPKLSKPLPWPCPEKRHTAEIRKQLWPEDP